MLWLNDARTNILLMAQVKNIPFKINTADMLGVPKWFHTLLLDSQYLEKRIRAEKRFACKGQFEGGEGKECG